MRSWTDKRRPAGLRLWIALSGAVIILGAAAAAADEKQDAKAKPPPKGTTAQIIQEIDLGDLSCRAEYRAKFLPPHRFRVHGKMVFVAREVETKTIMVGDGSKVRQLSETPAGPQAVVVDLERIWKLVPEYAPSKTFDPAVYKPGIDSMPDVTRLPAATMDGVPVEGFDVPLKKGRLSLPSNLQLGLPQPARMRVWLDRKDGVARKVEIKDARGSVFMTMTYNNVRTGVAIPAEQFEFEFPKGVVPRDMTDLVLGAVATTRVPPPKDQPAPEKKQKSTDKGGEP